MDFFFRKQAEKKHGRVLRKAIGKKTFQFCLKTKIYCQLKILRIFVDVFFLLIAREMSVCAPVSELWTAAEKTMWKQKTFVFRKKNGEWILKYEAKLPVKIEIARADQKRLI